MGILQVVNLLRIANNNLPSVQRRYNQLQKQNNNLESNPSIAAREFQNLSNHISFMGNRLDELKSECENEIARLQDLRYQTANLQTVINELKNDDNGEYTKVIKAVKEEVQKNLSNIKPLLDLALFSTIQSMRENPDKYSCLVYSDNPRLIVDSNYRHISSGRQQQSQYNDYYSIEDCKAEILDLAKEFYILLVDRIVCEVVNGCVTNLSGTTSVPALSLEEGGVVDDDKQN
jgi:DNA repair exonuclease SbcCD ATPase subunit